MISLHADSGEPAGMEEVVEFPAQHECAYQTTWMNPAIWSDLPEELLQRVFSRLPLACIIRLRCLSKQWNMIVNSQDFKQECTDVHPKMFAIISHDYSSLRNFTIKLYDLRSSTWHAMQIDTEYQGRNFHTMNASDGGLVCIACTAREVEHFSVLVLVCNPLTRTVRALPLHSHYKRPPSMLQLVMDCVSKCYQVLIVSTGRNGGLVPEIFHSNTGAWTSANPSEKRDFLGSQYQWYIGFTVTYAEDGAPCVYDCAKGHFLEIPEVADLRDETYFTMDFGALVQDRLFVFCRIEREAIKGGREWFFAEYQFLESGAKWLKLKDHRSSNLGSTRCYPRRVFACKSFILVDTMPKFIGHKNLYLYDLCTGKWHAFSPGFQQQIFHGNVMCELQWDVVP